MTEWASIDFESRATVDLRKSGVFPYAQHPDTAIICMAYALDDGPVELWLPGQPFPADLAAHIEAGGKLRAWNSQFEMVLWQNVMVPRHEAPAVRPDQWYCTAAMAAVMSLPRSLDQCAQVLGMQHQKDKDGYNLMMRMCKPRKVNDDGSIIWWDEPEKIDRLGQYCRQDVEVERALAARLRPLIPDERKLFVLDQKINDRGVRIDRHMVEAARAMADASIKKLNRRLYEVTSGKVSAATKAADLTAWIRSQGIVTEGISKADVRDLLSRPEVVGDLRDAIEIRAEAAKASNAKLTSMLKAACDDDRVRGMWLYCGAGTGRWTGRLVMLHNMPRGTVKHAHHAIDLIKHGDIDLLEALFGPTLDVVSSNLRGCIIPADGCDFTVADYSNIEGRVTSWLGDTPGQPSWKTKAFEEFDTPLLDANGQKQFDKKGEMLRAGPDLYKLAYAKSFNVSVEDVTSENRQIGKVQELACGFGGGKGAFQAMATIYGVNVSDDDAESFKTAWREAHPHIVKLWYGLERAAHEAIETPWIMMNGERRRNVVEAAHGRIKFVVKAGFLWMILPSGRALAYASPAIVEKEMKWGGTKHVVSFWGINSITRKWERQYLWGGLACENAVQAIARDILAAAMFRLEDAGYPIVMHVHDEIVAETPIGFGSVSEMEQIMCESPEWAVGLPVAAAGWRGPRYRKG